MISCDRHPGPHVICHGTEHTPTIGLGTTGEVP